MSYLIELDNIRKSYRKMVALKDVSLQVEHGITGLLGPNGAGKSTLIKVLLGLVRLNSGSGSVLGKQLGKEGREIRSLVGYMPEDDCYFTGMTGIEMVTFCASLSGIPAGEAMRRSHEILDFCGVQQERYRSVEGYSTGMRQKVKFAGAIVHDPELLILDEPTSGLDPEERESLLNRVSVLCKGFKKSALISTHILPDVQAICDNVIILAEGEVRVSSSLAELSKPTSPKFMATVVEGEERLVAKLNRASLAAELTPTMQVSVNVSNETDLQLFYQICDQNDIVLKSLVPSLNSLQEIFMAAIGGGNNANS
ncbi:MAG: ABC transporter ATP-binding protein [Pirellulaceae bacterium]|nr:ABC transporter ATP-binding protein [Pirellulaceae bacterium]MDG2102385.1 ABC transporter ATP-binding protein [Pirellulaceae bacterium]